MPWWPWGKARAGQSGGGSGAARHLVATLAQKIGEKELAAKIVEFCKDACERGFDAACETLAAPGVKEVSAAGAVATAGVASVAVAPWVGVLVCVTLFCGPSLTAWRKNKKKDAELKGELARLAASIEKWGASASGGALAEQFERDGWVPVRLDNVEKHEIAAFVVREVGPLLAGHARQETLNHMRIVLDGVSAEVWAIRKQTASVPAIAAHAALLPGIDGKIDTLAASVAKINEFLAGKQAVASGGDGPAPATSVPPDVENAARVVRARTTDQIERTRAEIVLAAASGDFSKADAVLADLRTHDALTHAFDILTLEGDRWYYANEIDRAIEPYESAWALRRSDFGARSNLAIALQQSRAADTRVPLRRAVELHHGTLDLVTAESPGWAATQNNLAIALRNQATASEGPERARLLGEAVGAFRAALTVYTREALPQQWAATQNNLTAALCDQASASEGPGRARLLGEAVDACRTALTVYTREALPQDWAMTQHNLAAALCDQASASEGTERARLLGEAVDAYRAALTVRTREALPQQWAMTQNNLAVSLRNQASASEGTERARLLGEAVEAYRAALTVRTREALPQDWAATQNNLAVALGDQASASEGPERARLLDEAVDAYRAALTVYTREALPQQWAATQNNLAIALRNQASASEGPERARLLDEAVDAYRAALTVRTREALPQQWAATQNNLAVALADQAEATPGQRCELLREAIACGKAALMVRTREHFPQHHRQTSNNLAIDRRAYEEGGCAHEVAFDDIAPAR